jgi:hypothetical protein
MLRLRQTTIIVSLSLSISMAVFLVILQMTNVYGAMTPLPSQLTGSATAQKIVQCCTPLFLAPISTSGNNVYITWSSNKTGGNFEIMFRASTDDGKTFGPKINLSNSTKFDSVDPSIGSEGGNVYVSWWEVSEKDGIKEPAFRASNDNGQTFGERIILSNATVTLTTNAMVGNTSDGNSQTDSGISSSIAPDPPNETHPSAIYIH